MPQRRNSQMPEGSRGVLTKIIDALIKQAKALGRDREMADLPEVSPEIRAIFGHLDEMEYLSLTVSYGPMNLDAEYKKPMDKLLARIEVLAQRRGGLKFDRATRTYVRESL